MKTTSVLLFIFSVLIAAISQILLKTSANKHHKTLLKEYLNVRVMLAYFLFFGSSLLTVFAYKGLPLSLGPILEGTSYVYIAIMSVLFLKEKLSKKQIFGLILIVIGIIVCYIPL